VRLSSCDWDFHSEVDMTEPKFDVRAMIDNGGESGAIVTSFACSVKAPGTPHKTLVAALARPRWLPRPGPAADAQHAVVVWLSISMSFNGSRLSYGQHRTRFQFHSASPAADSARFLHRSSLLYSVGQTPVGHFSQQERLVKKSIWRQRSQEPCVVVASLENIWARLRWSELLRLSFFLSEY